MRCPAVLIVLAVVGSCGIAMAGPLDPPTPLPAPKGRVVRVDSEPALQRAVSNITSHTTILIAPGTYKLTRTLYLKNVEDVALRGDTNNRDAVVLAGTGMANTAYGDVPYGIWAGEGVTDV